MNFDNVDFNGYSISDRFVEDHLYECEFDIFNEKDTNMLNDGIHDRFLDEGSLDYFDDEDEDDEF